MSTGLTRAAFEFGIDGNTYSYSVHSCVWDTQTRTGTVDARRDHLFPKYVNNRSEIHLRDQATLDDVAGGLEVRDFLGGEAKTICARRVQRGKRRAQILEAVRWGGHIARHRRRRRWV